MAPEQSSIPGDQNLRIGFVSTSAAPRDLPPGARPLPHLAASANYDLVVVDQDWPDQFTESEAESLLGGTARVICRYGPWCESDGRTRSVWPHSVRTPRSTWPDVWLRELEMFAGHRPAPPLTAARDELFLASRPADIRLACTVTVDSPDRVLRTVITARLIQAGCTLGDDGGLAAIVDADPWNAATRERFGQWKQSPAVQYVIALAGFRRDTAAAEMLQAGADAVVDKLHLDPQLLRVLAEFQDMST